MKKRILVYWDYRRRDLLKPFEKLTDYFDWYFIFFRHKKEDPVPSSNNVLYWVNYSSPYKLLKKVQPDAVIFSDLSSLYAVALNIACKNEQCPTYLLEHGVKLSYDYYLRMEIRTRSLKNGKEVGVTHGKTSGRLHTFRFYFSILRGKNIASWFNIFKLFYSAFLVKSDGAFRKVKFPLRNPDKYLLFSSQNYPYYYARDGISNNEVIYFGNPHLDEYINGLDQSVSSKETPYYLLLDDGQVEAFGISVAQKNDFTKKLNEFALSKNARLIVKLHPFDYGRKDLFHHPNVLYLESANIPNLIIHSQGCFAISTTLMLPLIPEGKVIMFRVKESTIQDALVQFGVDFLDYINFGPSEIDFTKCKLDPSVKDEFVERFLYKKDGKALERLKRILEQ